MTIILIVSAIVGLNYINHKGIIMIKNESNDDLTNVIVTYYSIGKHPLPDISAKSSYKSSIDYTNHNEQSTYISYY